MSTGLAVALNCGTRGKVWRHTALHRSSERRLLTQRCRTAVSGRASREDSQQPPGISHRASARQPRSPRDGVLQSVHGDRRDGEPLEAHEHGTILADELRGDEHFDRLAAALLLGLLALTCTVAPHHGPWWAKKQMWPHRSSIREVIAPPWQRPRWLSAAGPKRTIPVS
eukprot:5751327-Prymnesium_polylepis.1